MAHFGITRQTQSWPNVLASITPSSRFFYVSNIPVEDICTRLSRNFYFFFGGRLRQLNSLYTGLFFTSFAIVFVVAVVVVLVETASVILSRGLHSLKLTKLANIFTSARHVRQEKEITFPLTSYMCFNSDR